MAQELQVNQIPGDMQIPIKALIVFTTSELGEEYLRTQIRTLQRLQREKRKRIEFKVYMPIDQCLCCNAKILRKNQNECIQLDCGCYLCNNQCVQNYSFKKANIRNKNYLEIYDKRDQIVCKCQQKISSKIIYNAFGGKTRVRLINLTCQMCYMDYPLEELRALWNCEHKFCTGCILGYLEYMINSNQVKTQELVCPSQGCKTPIGQIVDLLISELDNAEQMREKYDRFVTRNLEVDGRSVVYCPGTDCNWGYLPEEDDLVVDCDECGHEFCRLCLDDPHEEMTCEEYKQHKLEMNQGDMNEEDFLKFVKENNFQQCPHCGAYGERVRGCKFMTCYSTECKRQKFYCYLCGDALTQAEHYSHFFGKPFGEKCLKTDPPN